jgi:cytochrome c oxidase cbb3-type subunit 1
MTADIASTSNASAPTNADLDASCRGPVAFLLISASLWLVAATVLGLIAAWQLHSPEFLAGCEFLTHGRVKPAASNALLYGFTLQAAFGVALWLICRLGRAPLSSPIAVFLGSKLWNVGVTLGVAGILIGDNSGYEGFEMPRYAAPLLLVAYLLIGGNALVTMHERRQRGLFASQWYLLLALLWFPWIYSTALWLLHVHPVRGITQSVVNWWFVGNLHCLVLVPFALAAAHYVVPKLTERPLHSRDLALFGFWTLVFVGGWSGIPAGAPIPAWFITVSIAAAALTLVPALAVLGNLLATWKGRFGLVRNNPALAFALIGLVFFFGWSARAALFSFRTPAEFLRFSNLSTAQNQLLLAGAVGCMLFAAIYELAPRLAGVAWPCRGMARVHFWGTLVGTVLFQVSLVVPAIRGAKSLEGAVGALPIPVAAFAGLLVLAVGNLAFVGNVCWLIVRHTQACGCRKSVASLFQPAADPEVAS